MQTIHTRQHRRGRGCTVSLSASKVAKQFGIRGKAQEGYQQRFDCYFALYQWQDKHRTETTKAKKEQILDMACGKVKLFQKKHYGRRQLPFDTKGLVITPV